MELKKAILKRRSVRGFSDKSVPYSTVEEIINYGTWAPSSCNRQMWNFIVIDKKKLRKHDEVFHHVNKINANWAVVITYHKVYNSQFYANIQSAAGAIMNMVLTATDMGIDSIWMAERGNEKKIREFLNIPDDQLMIATVVLGHSNGDKIFPPARRPLSDVIHRNTFREGYQLWPDNRNTKYWDTDQIVRCVDFCMRAKSPSKLYYLSNQAQEYDQILKDFPKLKGETLMLYDFSGEFSTDLLQKKKAKKLTIHALSKNIREFILERTINEKVPKEQLEWLEGDFLKLKHKKKYDNVVVFKRFEKIPDPEKVFDSLLKNNVKKGTNIYLYFQSKYNLEDMVRWLFKLQRKIIWTFKKPFQQVEPVGLFGPVRALDFKEIKQMISDNRVEVVEDYGLDLVPGIRANAGPPFWGNKVVPSTKLERLKSKSLFRFIFRTRIIHLKVK